MCNEKLVNQIYKVECWTYVLFLWKCMEWCTCTHSCRMWLQPQFKHFLRPTLFRLKPFRCLHVSLPVNMYVHIWAPLHHCVGVCECWCWCGCVCAYISYIHPTCYHLLLFLLATVSVMSDHICLRFYCGRRLTKTVPRTYNHTHTYTSRLANTHRTTIIMA